MVIAVGYKAGKGSAGPFTVATSCYFFCNCLFDDLYINDTLTIRCHIEDVDCSYNTELNFFAFKMGFPCHRDQHQ
jgi:hypothetical protein